jgi:hypothetical protein
MERLVGTQYAEMQLGKARAAGSAQQPAHGPTTVDEPVARRADDEAERAQRSCQNGSKSTALHGDTAGRGPSHRAPRRHPRHRVRFGSGSPSLRACQRPRAAGIRPSRLHHPVIGLRRHLRQTTLAEELIDAVPTRYIDSPVRSCRTRSPTAYGATWVSRQSSTNPRMRSLSDRGSMPSRHYRDTTDSPLLPIGHSPY